MRIHLCMTMESLVCINCSHEPWDSTTHSPVLMLQALGKHWPTSSVLCCSQPLVLSSAFGRPLEFWAFRGETVVKSPQHGSAWPPGSGCSLRTSIRPAPPSYSHSQRLLRHLCARRCRAPKCRFSRLAPPRCPPRPGAATAANSESLARGAPKLVGEARNIIAASPTKLQAVPRETFFKSTT